MKLKRALRALGKKKEDIKKRELTEGNQKNQRMIRCLKKTGGKEKDLVLGKNLIVI